MKPNPIDPKSLASADREPPARERDDARERRRDREWRIGAAQMAAPSTRRWRRAGTFGSSS